MNKAKEHTEGHLRDMISSLAKVCPVENCNPEDCPLFGVRQMNMRKRLQWLKALGKEDAEHLIAYHFVCMEVKLGACATKTGKDTPLARKR